MSPTPQSKAQQFPVWLSSVADTLPSPTLFVVAPYPPPLGADDAWWACGIDFEPTLPYGKGANLFHCPHCQHRHWAPRSCGNRHCPRCLAAKSWQWLEKQTRSLLPITYYHCVFTLPAELHSLMLANQGELYPLLFDCAAQSLLEFGRNRLGGNLGITAVLHTWGQKLDFHPHLHCIVTGGALNPDGKQWRSPKQRKFLFPVGLRSRLDLKSRSRKRRPTRLQVMQD